MFFMMFCLCFSKYSLITVFPFRPNLSIWYFMFYPSYVFEIFLQNHFVLDLLAPSWVL
eukprot:UN16703